MNEVIPSLFISSVEEAQKALEIVNATVVSIGAPLQDFDYGNTGTDSLCFVDIQDKPEELIMHILIEAREFIGNKLSMGLKVLVHCVFGQSRSAAVIIAYLIHIGYSLDVALDLLSSRRPSICINPGFLSQLHLLYNMGTYRVEYEMVLRSAAKEVLGPPDFTTGRRVKCRQCGYTLCYADAILVPRDCREFFDKYTDSFWRGYRPVLFSEQRIIRIDEINSLDCIIVFPLSWSSQGANQSISCPKCNSICGQWHIKKSLALCSGFILVNYCELFKAAIRRT